MEDLVTREAGDLTKEYMASYSRYVAQSRAIPNLVDGLKPVQRRIITSADDLHLSHSGAYTKTARLEGHVMGSYHPHGGADATTLVQPFKIRYPLLEGQGNWGCPDDPNSVAASRYTEVRLTKFAEDFYLSSRKYADTCLNYDGRLEEVSQYYPPVPGSLLTGSEGIAIGLTTKVPSHEIGSICRSLLKYISDPESDDYLEGLHPDTCEKSILVSTEDEVRKLYTTGEASIRYRAVTHYEKSGDMHSLVVDAFPPGFSRKKFETGSILQYVDDGSLTLQNESSTGTRYVFSSKSLGVLAEVEKVLESSVSYKMHLEYDRVVSLYTLKMVYDRFLESRRSYIIRKYTSMKSDVEETLAYLKGLLYVKETEGLLQELLNYTEDQAVEVLGRDHSISESITKKILNSSLKSLLKNNIAALKDKIRELERSSSEYQSYIDDPLSRIIQDIKDIQSMYSGDPNTVPTDVRSNPSYVVINHQLDTDPTRGSAPLISKYYFLYDEDGFVVMEGEYLRSKYPSHILKSDTLKGIIGFDTFENLYVVYDDVKVPLDTWSIKKRSSKIICKESQSKVLLKLEYLTE